MSPLTCEASVGIVIMSWSAETVTGADHKETGEEAAIAGSASAKAAAASADRVSKRPRRTEGRGAGRAESMVATLTAAPRRPKSALPLLGIGKPPAARKLFELRGAARRAR